MPAADPRRLAEQQRARQALIAATLTRDLIRLLRALFSPADPGPSWQATRMAAAALVRDRRRTSADAAARFYREARAAAGAAGRVEPASPVDLPEARLLANLDATGIGFYSRAVRAGANQRQAVDRAAAGMSGAGVRLALEGGRSVVDRTSQADPEAVGWVRVTDADPCPWCLMMASRGAVYHSEQTAGRAKNSRFIGDGQFKWHDHCGCVATPVFSHTDPVLDRADRLYEQWRQVTAGHSGRNAVNAWRRYWDTKQAGGSETDARQAAAGPAAVKGRSGGGSA